MNLFADESVDRPVVERLREDSHDVTYVAELTPSVTDDELLREANTRSAVLVTADKDFGELVFRQGVIHSGDLSLVDCVSFEFMRAQGLREALALDEDFASAGYRLLPTSGR